MTDSLPQLQYPLSENADHSLKTSSGRMFGELHMDALMNDKLTEEDLHIRAETLHAQAEIARQNGFHRLAENLMRAAELTRVPNSELLKMYEALRPGRSSKEQLLNVAETLERVYQAQRTARFVREAVEAYASCGLFGKDSG